MKHGLAVPILDHPSLAQEVHARARAIAAEAGLDSPTEALVRLSAAELDLERITEIRATLMRQLEVALGIDARASTTAPAPPATVTDLIRQLDRLDRYMRRALSHHRRCVRALSSSSSAR